MESGEGIESSQTAHNVWRDAEWNPVKELKVTRADPFGLLRMNQWNPVKELKDELRRSGWRAERGLWNPVKELKV